MRVPRRLRDLRLVRKSSTRICLLGPQPLCKDLGGAAVRHLVAGRPWAVCALAVGSDPWRGWEVKSDRKRGA